MLLTGCYRSQQVDIFYDVETEYAWLNGQPTDYTLSLSQLDFSPTDAANFFDFEKNKQLLLKIKFNEVAFNPQNHVFTLVASPTNLHKVAYYLNDETTTSAQLVNTQNKYQASITTPLSGQQYAFNVNNTDLFKTHYLLIQSGSPNFVQINLYDAQSFFKDEIQNNQLSSALLTLILAITLFSIVSYFFSTDKTLLLHAVFSGTSLLALLWQSKMINHLPWLLWPIIGPNSHLLFAFVAGFSGFALIHHLASPHKKHNWIVKLLTMVLLLQFGLLVYMAFPELNWQMLEFVPVTNLFNLLLLLTYFLLLIVLLVNKTRLINQEKLFILAYAIIVIGLAFHVYNLFVPHPDLTWMTRFYQLSVVIGLAIMSIALKYSSAPQEKEQHQEVVHAKPNTNIFKHRLITQFQQQMQKLTDDSTLSEAEVEEKTHIKFHLLLTQAFPIKNSLILTNKEIEGVCTTGIDTPDIEFLRQLALELADKEQPVCTQKLIGMAGDKQSNVLFVPLKKHDDPKVVFILTLKTNESLEQETLAEIQTFCEDAYSELCQARSRYETAFAANLDSLTLCYNRESTEIIIKHSLDQRKLTTLAYIDLDNMKSHGDQQGVATTNQLLAEFAQKLKNHLASTAKIGRIGSDEFLVVFSGYDLNTCIEQLESFNEILQNQVDVDEPQLTCSTGIAESRMNETTRTLIKKAKTAMQHAKNQGGNQIALFEVDMTS